jgi:hypothetical protein
VVVVIAPGEDEEGLADVTEEEMKTALDEEDEATEEGEGLGA